MGSVEVTTHMYSKRDAKYLTGSIVMLRYQLEFMLYAMNVENSDTSGYDTFVLRQDKDEGFSFKLNAGNFPGDEFHLLDQSLF